MTEQRLPTVNSDNGAWGDLLNQYLQKEHYNTGSDNAANGGHQHITVRAGTTAAGTAPIKLASGSLMTTSEEGALEYASGLLYYTSNQNSLIRKIVQTVDPTSAATGDMYYLNASNELVRLPIGSGTQFLGVVSGVPAWATPSGGGGSSRSVNVISTATSAGATAGTDYVYLASGTTTVTLPTAVGNSNRYTVTNTGTNVITVATTSSQTINGSTTAAMPIANMSLDFISNGSNWIVQ
jgi:hypothetical protein